MKNHYIELIYLYHYIDCTIEAGTKEDAIAGFWQEVEENEGAEFAERAKLHGRLSITSEDEYGEES